ncbi:hypothetical protein SRM1_03945 [Pseudomonas fluorescens]|nr:hypothetical protein SRM1_03945 [Pseudomonas fluorescens]
MVFSFTLNYELTSDESDMDTLVERLAEEGCDDALEFVREAPSAHYAVKCPTVRRSDQSKVDT